MEKISRNLKKLLSLCLLFQMSSIVYAKTLHSELVEYLQTKYTQQGQEYPILIMDQDEIDLRYAVGNATGDDDESEKRRAQILKAYVAEQIGVELSDTEASSLEPYTHVLKEGAYAVPLFNNYTDKKYKICSVFPASTNSNIRLETHRILGLDTPGAYPTDMFFRLKEHIPFDILKMYSVLHELGHCLDKTFMPAAYSNYEPSAHDVHESESFAETFATFMLIKEGHANWAQTRALYRNLYTRYMGQWFVDNPHNGFGNPLYLKGGVIYYLSPSLLEANYVIKRNRDIKEKSVAEYIQLAEDVVNKNALDFRAFQGIWRTFGEDTEEVLDFYREFSFDSPGLFQKAFEQITAFLDFSPYLERKIVGDFRAPELLGSQPLLSLEEERRVLVELITDYQNTQSEMQGEARRELLREEIFSRIDLLRENLEQAFDAPYEAQKKQKEFLDYIWAEVLKV
ncbi:MAG: hypothetical protein CME63_01150 [Halobacteriovoraceae bacterium]|nr:hypothetical protein [Halobacteriovoraceae bacterium]MBC96329.1 hypothetical protein [Halobacteriovoraceae bacterium]|tara:strand:- start:3776 stop:5140 length:1365 start_codon:yes stop_codon:yes gene_type:complete